MIKETKCKSGDNPDPVVLIYSLGRAHADIGSNARAGNVACVIGCGLSFVGASEHSSHHKSKITHNWSHPLKASY